MPRDDTARTDGQHKMRDEVKINGDIGLKSLSSLSSWLVSVLLHVAAEVNKSPQPISWNAVAEAQLIYSCWRLIQHYFLCYYI